MNVEGISSTGNSAMRLSDPAQKIDANRKVKDEPVSEPQVDQSRVPPEELLQQIKSLTEEGLYSVRFEKDRVADQLVVKIVDSETDEVIRQLPAEELIALRAALEDLRGNIVNTKS